MLFNSFAFLLFFPIVIGGHFLLPQRGRWALLNVPHAPQQGNHKKS